jgi:hypothetical protein
MKANELMIDDWVQHPVNEKPYKVVSLTSDVELEDGGFYEEVDPAPLTAEILERNGFGYVRNDVNPYDDEVLSHFYLGEKGYCANVDIHIGTYNKGVFWFNSPRVSLNCIRYVHEFQHAIRLCNIEKEIEL